MPCRLRCWMFDPMARILKSERRTVDEDTDRNHAYQHEDEAGVQPQPAYNEPGEFASFMNIECLCRKSL